MATEAPSTLDSPLSALVRLELLNEEFKSSSKEAALYLRDLARTSVDAIEQQPAQQQTSALSLQHQLSELCTRNTPTFVLSQSAFDQIPLLTANCDEKISNLSNNLLYRVQEATKQFEHSADVALASRKAIFSVKNVMQTSVHQLFRMPQLVNIQVSKANYEEALQLARHFFLILPAEGPNTENITKALLDDMYSALYRAQILLLQALRDPYAKQPQARAWASYLFRVISLAHEHYRDTELDLRKADICFHFLHSRFMRIHGCFKSRSDLLNIVDTWKDVVLNTCSMALSIFVDNQIAKICTVDTSSEQLISMFCSHAVECLYAFLSRTLLHQTHTPSGSIQSWEAMSQHLENLYSKLCFVSESLASVGVYMDVSLIPYSHAAESQLGAFDHAALSLWTASLRSIHLEELRVTPPETDTECSLPRALAEHPVCVGIGRQVVMALNVLRHFAPLHIQRPAVDAMGKKFAQILSNLSPDAHPCFMNVLVPWASSALTQGVFDMPEQSYSLHDCDIWRQACKNATHTAPSPALR